MLIMIDNYDSFTYNLVQYLGILGAQVKVYRNDKITPEEVEAQKPDGVVTTVNLRAPIVLDPKSLVARQCVTSAAQYQVQQPLFGPAAAALGA